MESLCVHFCRQQRLQVDPDLVVGNRQLQFVSEGRYFGLMFNSKLNLRSHLRQIKKDLLYKSSEFITCFKSAHLGCWSYNLKIKAHLFFEAQLWLSSLFICTIFRFTYVGQCSPCRNSTVHCGVSYKSCYQSLWRWRRASTLHSPDVMCWIAFPMFHL